MSPTIGGIVLAKTAIVAGFTTETVDIAAADTEYAHTLPANTRMFVIQNRDNGLVRLYHTSGGSDFWTIFPGQQFPGLNLDGTGVTVYLQSPKASQTVEVISWQ